MNFWDLTIYEFFYIEGSFQRERFAKKRLSHRVLIHKNSYLGNWALKQRSLNVSLIIFLLSDIYDIKPKYSPKDLLPTCLHSCNIFNLVSIKRGKFPTRSAYKREISHSNARAYKIHTSLLCITVNENKKRKLTRKFILVFPTLIYHDASLGGTE